MIDTTLWFVFKLLKTIFAHHKMGRWNEVHSNEGKSKRYYVRTPKKVFVNLFFAISKAFSPLGDNL
jgi:hypothetical protein